MDESCQWRPILSDPVTRVRTILADVLGVDLDEVGEDADIDNMEDWTSFAHVRAIAALEEEFGVRFAAWRIPELSSVKTICSELQTLGV